MKRANTQSRPLHDREAERPRATRRNWSARCLISSYALAKAHHSLATAGRGPGLRAPIACAIGVRRPTAVEAWTLTSTEDAGDDAGIVVHAAEQLVAFNARLQDDGRSSVYVSTRTDARGLANINGKETSSSPSESERKSGTEAHRGRRRHSRRWTAARACTRKEQAVHVCVGECDERALLPGPCLATPPGIT